MSRYLFYSHDGFGLGHARRNMLIARAVLAEDPGARVVLVTGVGARVDWLRDDAGIELVRVPPLLKDSRGAYRSGDMPFEAAVAARAERVSAEVRRHPPDVVVVDRHPYGTGGELRPALQLAREAGAALVLGLRDVLDEPGVIRQEMAGRGWAGVSDLYDRTLVYGEAHVVDHVAEYDLPVAPKYCGWVVAPEPAAAVQPRVLAVAAGGGGDGAAVFELGRDLLDLRPSWRGVVAAGPYAGTRIPALTDPPARLEVLRRVGSCGPLFAHSAAVLCMAGYNTTVEALAAGHRPILVPRRSPRREQAIRAWRLAALGVADVVDEGSSPHEVSWLLDRDRALRPRQLAQAGLRLDGAERVARTLVALARSGSRR